MDTADRVLIKYCFSQPSQIIRKKEEYYVSILTDLTSGGFIQSIDEYEIEDPFSNDKIRIKYQVEPLDTYIFSFRCIENRMKSSCTFSFSISFRIETHKAAEILYVDISSTDYQFTLDSESNCLEVLKHKLREELNIWSNRYCLLDEQSLYYASLLYPQINRVENYFRYYVNDVFIKVFGANWWNEAIASSIKESRKERISDTREYAGAYKDIQPYLLSLELGDLMEVARTKRVKWNPKFDCRIENALNRYSKEDIIPILNKQCDVEIDIWARCFSKHLNSNFEENYLQLEKRRNQVAHNKLLDYDSYKIITELCDIIYREIEDAHKKFCLDYLSYQEQEELENYHEEVSLDDENQRIFTMKFIAEEESGIRTLSSQQIQGIFIDTFLSLYNSIKYIFEDRHDFDFSILHTTDANKDFTLKSLIRNEHIYICMSMDINDSPGGTSSLSIDCEHNGKHTKYDIIFTNGRYSYNEEQCTFMPETKDSLSESSYEEAKVGICELVENIFPNLREEADLYNHLDAMGKASAITENDVQCFDCGEEYICINEEFAPIGTCLNCGAKNKILYCTICEVPVEAVDIEDSEDDPIYCPYHEDKLFGDD